MAKLNKGLLNIKGSIGDYTFYELNGQLIVRKKGGGFNTEAIKTKKSMAPTRQYGKEFGGCSRLVSSYRNSFSWFYQHHKDGSLHGRLMSMVTKVKNLDPVSVRGERVFYRGLETLEGRSVFEGFVYTPKCSIGSILGSKFSMDWDSLKLRIETMFPDQVFYPKGATHLELQLVVLVFDFQRRVYEIEFATPEQIERSRFPGVLELGISEMPKEKGTRLSFLAIRYYEMSGGQLFAYHNQDFLGLELVDVWY